jgi:hypothetical protein
MKQFPSIEKLDKAILYALELASSIMANVLTKGSVLTDNLLMQSMGVDTVYCH